MAAVVRLCIIGAGGHASRHIYPYLYRLQGVRVVANADLNEAKARRVAALTNIPATYTDYRKMLETERPDGVIVCINRQMHTTLAIEIMEMGYHVYTEKPNADTFEQSKQVLETQRKTGRICMVAYKKRFSPAYQKAKAIVTGEEFGVPSLLTMVRTRAPLDNDNPTGEYLLEWACHAIDLVPYLFGPISHVHTFITRGTTHSYAISMQFESGAVGSVCFSNRPGEPVREEVSLLGTNRIRIDLDNSINMIAYRDGQPFVQHKPEFSSGSYYGSVEQGFLCELQEFANAIAEGRQPESNIEQATYTMAVYDAIQQSARTGQVVEVERTGILCS